MIGSDAYNYINVLNKAAGASWTKNEIIANNIANVDTPGYKRQDIDFQSALKNELGRYKYTSLDKKSSVTKIVDDMSNSHTSFVDLFNDEFKALTGIGNNYRIRHHETDKIDITDIKHYDYFFNRCLSLIALAIQYLH